MRKTTYTIAALTLLCGIWLFPGCKPETTGEIGEPFDLIAGLTGTWELASFTQQDMNSPVKETRDLSHFYLNGIVTPLQLNFESGGEYAVAIEMGKNYFGTGGYWGFDDPVYPSYLELMTSEDTLVYNLGRMVRESDQVLDIEYRRLCGSSETVIYTFSFNRLN